MDWAPFVRAEYGNLASVAGLLAAFVGFGITWRNQRRQRKQTNEAFRSIEALTERLAFADAAAAVALCQEVRDTLKARKWDRAADRAQMLRNHLGRMVLSKRLGPDDRAFLIESKDDVQLILERTEKLEIGAEASLPHTLLKQVDRLLIQFTSIDGRLKNAQLEVRDGEPTLLASSHGTSRGDSKQKG